MKRKHYDLVAVTMLILSVIFTGFYYVHTAKSLASQRSTVSFKPIKKISLPEKGEIKKIRELETRMLKLAYPGIEDSSPVNLELFGYRPLAQPGLHSGRQGKIAHSTLPSYLDYKLTFAFAAGDKRYCVINGAFYSEGTLLPDGSRILKVEPDRVLVGKEKRTTWVEVSQSTAERKKKDDISISSKRKKGKFNEG